jgi:ATP-dependent exoDNAse (exonuclease V) alpha subunit
MEEKQAVVGQEWSARQVRTSTRLLVGDGLAVVGGPETKLCYSALPYLITQVRELELLVVIRLETERAH